MKKSRLALTIVLLLAATAAAQNHPRHSEPGYDLAEMYKMHFTKVNGAFWTGGQPPMDELARLKAGGITAIINLRHPSEHDAAGEEAEARRLGLRYFSIPVVFGDPKEEQVDEFLKLTDDPQNRPAFIHCTMAVRVGAFWMIRRVLRDGWSVDDAYAEARKIGLGARHLREFAVRYIEKHRDAKAPAAQREPYVVTPEWLAEHLLDANLVLLHVGDETEYAAAHIPGAVYFAFADMSTPRGQGLTLQVPPVEQLQEAFEKRGVSDDSRIVVYFGNDWATPTARLFVTLEYLGLGERASILDGGMPAWQAAGHAVTAEVPAPARGSLTPHPHPEVVADVDWVSAHLNDPSVALVDARNTQFYEGASAGRMPRAGHIPGAVNIPFISLLEESGKFKDVATLGEMFRIAGVKPGTQVVTYCHIGQQASLAYFVARMLGYEARVYDGSFEEWSQRPDLPVVNPAAAAKP